MRITDEFARSTGKNHLLISTTPCGHTIQSRSDKSNQGHERTKNQSKPNKTVNTSDVLAAVRIETNR